MKYAECYCEECNNSFKITFDNDIPPYSLTCPICGSDRVSVKWIDKAKIQKYDYVESVTDPSVGISWSS